MIFPTAYRMHERFPSEPGQREVTTYNPRVDSDGVLHPLEESGKDQYLRSDPESIKD